MKRSILVCLAGSLWGAPLLAQTPAPAEPPPAAAPAPDAAAKAAGPSVVVVADAFDDETENAKLRAKLYELARGKGFVPDSKADVRQAAEGADAMKDGRVAADEASLEKLRAALHAAVLIRVAREGSGLRVTVARDGGAKSKVVATPDAAVAAAGELIGGAAKGAAAAPAAAAAPSGATAGGSVEAGFIVKNKRPGDEEQDLGDPKVLKQAWEKRGGVRVSYGVRALVTGVMIPKSAFLDQNPETNAIEIGEATTYGVGGGVGVHVSMLYLPLPQPSIDGGSWAAFRLGAGFDLNGLYVRPPAGYSYKLTNGQVTSRDTKYDNKAFLYGVAPFQAGVHFGFGDFRLPTLWRGLAFGLAYSPALIFSLEVGKNQDQTQTDFNYAGFELSLDVAKLEVEERAQPQIRFFAMVLPRINDELPWLTSVGVGAVWY